MGERRNGDGMRLQWALYKCELQQNAMWIEKKIYIEKSSSAGVFLPFSALDSNFFLRSNSFQVYHSQHGFTYQNIEGIWFDCGA